MTQELPYVYRVFSEESCAELEDKIAHHERRAQRLRDEGCDHEATISRLVALGLRAVQNAGEDGLSDFELKAAIRTGRPHGERTFNRACDEVRNFARRLSDTDYELINK